MLFAGWTFLNDALSACVCVSAALSVADPMYSGGVKRTKENNCSTFMSRQN